MAKQLTFDLPHRAAQGRGDFFVSSSNAAALAAIDGWKTWPGRKMVLTGPEGAGKTHLVHVWAGQADASVIPARNLAGQDLTALAGRNVALEDADRISGDTDAEAAAFHLHNLTLAEGGSLLITGRDAPARWGLTLPDLASRLQGTALVSLNAPDEALLSAVLVKLFADRQIAAPLTLVQYLGTRIDRSFAAAQKIVADLDALALSEGRPLTRTLAARLLDKAGDEGA